MQKVILIFIIVLICPLLMAETMIINFSNGEIFEVDTSEILEISFENTSVEEMVDFISQIPIRFLKNHPNPFNPITTISFEIGEAGKTKIEIFNIKGQKIKTLLKQKMEIGKHSVDWEGNDNNNKRVSSGIYFYKISVNGKQKTNKMIMLK